MNTERGKLCGACKVDTERRGNEYICPSCGRVLGFVRPQPAQRPPAVEVIYIAGIGYIRKVAST